MTENPVAWGAAVQALIAAVIGSLQAFNAWNPTDAQIGAVTAAYVAVLGVIAVFQRSKVTPVANPKVIVPVQLGTGMPVAPPPPPVSQTMPLVPTGPQMQTPPMVVQTAPADPNAP